jgi:hypothetical protein
MALGQDFAIDAGGQFCKIIWKDGLSRNLHSGPAKIKKAATIIAHRMAPEVESHMKNNAPWTDRTGNARNGLAARAYEAGDEVGIVLYHQVSYGIWLEVRWSGRYAIINPTIDEMGPRVMQQFNNLLERI